MLPPAIHDLIISDFSTWFVRYMILAL